MRKLKQFICGLFHHPYRHWRDENNQMVIYCIGCNKILSTHKWVGSPNG